MRPLLLRLARLICFHTERDAVDFRDDDGALLVTVWRCRACGTEGCDRPGSDG